MEKQQLTDGTRRLAGVLTIGILATMLSAGCDKGGIFPKPSPTETKPSVTTVTGCKYTAEQRGAGRIGIQITETTPKIPDAVLVAAVMTDSGQVRHAGPGTFEVPKNSTLVVTAGISGQELTPTCTRA